MHKVKLPWLLALGCLAAWLCTPGSRTVTFHRPSLIFNSFVSFICLPSGAGNKTPSYPSRVADRHKLRFRARASSFLFVLHFTFSTRIPDRLANFLFRLRCAPCHFFLSPLSSFAPRLSDRETSPPLAAGFSPPGYRPSFLPL